MNRLIRIAIEVLLPPAIAAAYGVAGYAYFNSFESTVRRSPFMFVLAYAVLSIPSAVYAALMEGAFKLGPDPKEKMSIACAMALGAAIGFAVSVMLGSNELWARTGSQDLEFTAIGALNGAIVTSLIRRLEIRFSAKKTA